LCSAAMTESIDTAPLRGQSLRGRPVHEICTPVNQGNQLLLRRRGGGGLATALPSGRSRYVTCERPPRPRYQRWLRNIFLMRVHPSSRGGENALPHQFPP
jgi:hypothetical protein